MYQTIAETHGFNVWFIQEVLVACLLYDSSRSEHQTLYQMRGSIHRFLPGLRPSAECYDKSSIYRTQLPIVIYRITTYTNCCMHATSGLVAVKWHSTCMASSLKDMAHLQLSQLLHASYCRLFLLQTT
jgi:hypothetical protein